MLVSWFEQEKLEAFRLSYDSVYFKAGNVGKKYLEKYISKIEIKKKAIKLLPINIKKKIIIIYYLPTGLKP